MKNAENTKGKILMIVARVVVYTILIFLAFLCLFSFYMLIINATRSNAQLQAGFTLMPKNNFFVNLKNAWTDASINIPRGMLNSFFIATCSAVLTTYFSALTAYGIHVYNFKLKRAAFLFIMAVMMIPPQVSAVGFIQLVYKFHLTNNYIPLIIPSIAAPVVFFYMKQYLESVLPMEMVEAARVDGSGEFRPHLQHDRAADHEAGHRRADDLLLRLLVEQLLHSRAAARQGRDEDRAHHGRPAPLGGLLEIRHGQGVHVHPAGDPAGARGVHLPVQVHHQGRHRRLGQGIKQTTERITALPLRRAVF